MADNLIFPVKFDLEAAVKQAQGDADRLLRKLQTTLNSKPLAVNLKIVNAGGGSINEINARMGELVKQWNALSEAQRIGNKTTGEFTPEAKKILAEYTRLTGATESYARTLGQIASAARRSANEQERAMARVSKQRAKALGDAKRTLSATENSVANVTAKLQLWQKVLNSSDIGEKKFRRAADEVKRLTERLDVLKTKINEATGKTQQHGAATRQLSQEFQKQDSYLKNLLKKTAALWSLNQVTSFLTNIRQVTAEFELQRVSLGAIIQDQTRANQLFAEIKAFALKSPLTILDLTKYTKQVAAYGFETDKLFDTTKRLADISVGLGVDMSRLTLFLGQVFATGHLRASEVRQATEAGIPLVDKLAEKYSLLEQRTVSAAEVQDRISKRMVSFSMVEDIFKDMTEAGGMFYNMQEKQSQTLYGMWAKMGDAAAVMYEQIGNTTTVNSGMKALIQLLQDLMLHWSAFASVMQTSIVGFVAYKAAMAGVIPFYKLQTKLTKNQILAEKARAASQIQMMAVGRQLTAQEKFAVKTKNSLMAADWKLLLMEGKLSAAQKLTVARMAASNNQIRRAVLETGLFTKAQIAALGKMNAWQFFWAKFKLQLASVGQAFVNLGRQMLAFAPLAAITAVISLFQDWRAAVAAQNEAVKKVEKQYEETKVTLMEIENAYRDIQNASKAAGESEEEFAKSSFKQKLEQLEKVIKLLGQFGMKNVIDPSVLDYTNIDPVLDKWLAKLNEANELSRDWGREVALVANAYEGNVMGWSIFGENLKEDMKDLERAWTSLTVNTKFNDSLRQLRATVGDLANDNKEVYDKISKAIGADAKLALGQKRRNESELQYQQRIYKNYMNIYSWMQTIMGIDAAKVLPRLEAGDVQSMLNDFQSQVDEVMHEFDKVKEKFRDQDALTVKMAIDTVAAENDWTEWQKELLIQHLNEDPITLNAEIIPTGEIAAGQGAVAEGMKAIITSEFPTLFTEDELKSLVSIDDIYEAIKAKLDASNESIEKSVRLQNNLAYGSKGYENSLNRIKQLQAEITEVENMRAELSDLEARNGDLTSDELLRKSELEAKLAEADDASLNTKRAQIAAIVEANAKYDEQIKKQRESAEAEREIAKAALDRVSSMGLSDLGKDVKEQFSGLMVDAVKEMTDKNYSTDFLISDEELQKVRDVGDLYALWAQNTKAITEEKKKLAGVGITEATIEKERAALEEKRAKIQLQLSAVEKEIAGEKFKEQAAEYAKLKLALANAKTTEAQKTAQENLNKFLGDTKNAEFAILMLKKEGLKTTLQETLVSEAANNQVNNYLKGLDDAEKLWKELGKRYNFQLQKSGRGRGRSTKSDNRLQNLQEIEQTLTKINQKYDELVKKEGQTKAIEDINKLYADTLKYVNKLGKQFKLSFKMPTEFKDLQDYRKAILDVINTLKMKGYEKAALDLEEKIGTGDIDALQKQIEARIKELADKISRTKTAREFYDKVLGMTGDYELAAKVSVSIYGDTGYDLQKQLAQQVRQYFQNDQVSIEIPVDVITDDNQINYKKLGEFAEKMKKELGEEPYKAIKKIAEEGQKDLAKTYEGYLKDLEKTKTYADKRVELARTTAEKIRKINADIAAENIDEKVGKETIRGLQDKESIEAAKLEYEAFKDTPLYVQMFEDLEHASTSTLEMMKRRLERLKGVWGTALDPTQLKDIQSRMNEIDEQLRTRNPFKTLKESYQQYRDAVKGVSLFGAVQNAGAAAKDLYNLSEKYGADSAQARAAATELNARREIVKIARKITAENKKGAKALDAAAQIANDNLKIARGHLDIAKEQEEAAVSKAEKEGKDPAKDPRVIAAREKVEAAKKEVNLAERVAEITTNYAHEAKTWKESLSAAAETAFVYLNAASDLAHSIADLTEEFGGSEEDVQYWNDIGDALGNIAAGAQDLIKNILDFNVAGMVSSIVTALPKMAIGFSQLFSAGKVRKANKEIKRQQELLEQLEYTYGRLEAAADKLFGRDYVNNYNQQLKNLQAQQTAYLKQAEAERSKGKKKDKEKIKEYENQARETADKIKELQDDLVAHFTGSTKTDVARNMAKSWIDARASMSDTFAAIKGDYQDLIKNMIVEGAAARVIENALTPVWDSMQKMLDKNDVQGAIDSLVNGMDSALNAANNGMEVLWKALEARGYDMKQLIGDTDSEYTGIAKSVAGATSEEILQLSGFVNTALYHTAYLPKIYEELVAMRTASLPTATVSATSAGWTDWQQQAMDNYQAIARNTAETVVRCERAAIACEKMARVIKTKGATSGFNVFLNS